MGDMSGGPGLPSSNTYLHLMDEGDTCQFLHFSPPNGFDFRWCTVRRDGREGGYVVEVGLRRGERYVECRLRPDGTAELKFAEGGEFSAVYERTAEGVEFLFDHTGYRPSRRALHGLERKLTVYKPRKVPAKP
jgi:hypothetical protein